MKSIEGSGADKKLFKEGDSSDKTSEFSRDMSRNDEEGHSKNLIGLKNEEINKDIVQEVESENNWSDIYKSNKKIGRRKSLRRDELLKLKRRNSIRKSYSPISKSNQQKNNQDTLIKLHRVGSANKNIFRK